MLVLLSVLLSASLSVVSWVNSALYEPLYCPSYLSHLMTALELILCYCGRRGKPRQLRVQPYLILLCLLLNPRVGKVKTVGRNTFHSVSSVSGGSSGVLDVILVDSPFAKLQ